MGGFLFLFRQKNVFPRAPQEIRRRIPLFLEGPPYFLSSLTFSLPFFTERRALLFPLSAEDGTPLPFRAFLAPPLDMAARLFPPFWVGTLTPPPAADMADHPSPKKEPPVTNATTEEAWIPAKNGRDRPFRSNLVLFFPPRRLLSFARY